MRLAAMLAGTGTDLTWRAAGAEQDEQELDRGRARDGYAPSLLGGVPVCRPGGVRM